MLGPDDSSISKFNFPFSKSIPDKNLVSRRSNFNFWLQSSLLCSFLFFISSNLENKLYGLTSIVTSLDGLINIEGRVSI